MSSNDVYQFSVCESGTVLRTQYVIHQCALFPSHSSLSYTYFTAYGGETQSSSLSHAADGKVGEEGQTFLESIHSYIRNHGL